MVTEEYLSIVEYSLLWLQCPYTLTNVQKWVVCWDAQMLPGNMYYCIEHKDTELKIMRSVPILQKLMKDKYVLHILFALWSNFVLVLFKLSYEILNS